MNNAYIGKIKTTLLLVGVAIMLSSIPLVGSGFFLKPPLPDKLVPIAIILFFCGTIVFCSGQFWPMSQRKETP